MFCTVRHTSSWSTAKWLSTPSMVSGSGMLQKYPAILDETHGDRNIEAGLRTWSTEVASRAGCRAVATAALVTRFRQPGQKTHLASTCVIREALAGAEGPIETIDTLMPNGSSS